MSSSRTTFTTTFTTFTNDSTDRFPTFTTFTNNSTGESSPFTTFTNKFSDGLPSYSDVFPSAPLFDEFSSSIFGTAAHLSFEFNSTEDFGYSFLIRDSSGCLQAKGEVGHISTTLQNVHGMEMCRITDSSTNNVNNTVVHTFEVRNKNVKIGSVKVAEKGPASMCLQIINKNVSSEIIVRSLKLGDFAIYRGSSSSPICNIQMPHSDVYDAATFGGTIIFHPDTGITTEEQLLCTAAAIAFKVLMRQVAHTENSYGECVGYGLGIVVVIIIIAAFVFIYNYMERRNCEYRKAHDFSGYRDREC